MKNYIIISCLIVMAVLMSVSLSKISKLEKANDEFGSTMIVQSTYYGSTRSSSTIPITATTTNPILSADNSRIDALVCVLSGTSTVFLHESGESTTTGVVVNEGIPISTSSIGVGQPCQNFPGFKGYLFGISASPAVVSVSWHK